MYYNTWERTDIMQKVAAVGRRVLPTVCQFQRMHSHPLKESSLVIAALQLHCGGHSTACALCSSASSSSSRFNPNPTIDCHVKFHNPTLGAA